MIKKQTRVNKSVQEPVVEMSGTHVKKNVLLRYLFFIVFVLGALYLLKGFFIVALVNGRPISRISLITSLEKRYGKASLEELISKSIIESEAKNRSISVKDDQVNTEVDRIRKLVEGQGSTLEEALMTQGQTMDDLTENIRIQKTLELILGDATSVSDDEAMKYFDENKETFGEDAKFEDLKEDLISSLKQQKMGVEFEKWLTEKKSTAKIMYFADFK